MGGSRFWRSPSNIIPKTEEFSDAQERDALCEVRRGQRPYPWKEEDDDVEVEIEARRHRSDISETYWCFVYFIRTQHLVLWQVIIHYTFESNNNNNNNNNDGHICVISIAW